MTAPVGTGSIHKMLSQRRSFLENTHTHIYINPRTKFQVATVIGPLKSTSYKILTQV